MGTHSVKYSIVDVFTETQFSGNPLAVIHDARGLSSEQMQNIACEFGLSETTFILPSPDKKYFAQVRIFTPLEEIPFAGHPNIGTAFVIGRHKTAVDVPSADEIVFSELGGDVPVKIVRDGSEIVGATIKAPQTLKVLGSVAEDRVAECLGLSQEKIVSDLFEPCVASVGLPFAFAQLKSVGDLGSASPDLAAFRKAAEVGPETVDDFALCGFVVLEQNHGEFKIRSRVFSPLGHPPEDPATGSASGALAALISKNTGFCASSFQITQGVEMGRPSLIRVSASEFDGTVQISGRCNYVGSGFFELEV